MTTATPSKRPALAWDDLLMLALAGVFVAVLVVQYTMNLSAATTRRLNLLSVAIWAVFAADFLIRLALAPSKLRYLKSNWISAMAVALPALRVLRVFQMMRLLPAVHAAAIATGGTHGSSALRRLLSVHTSLYVSILMLLLMALAAAGMYALEHNLARANIRTVQDSVWWTTATLTTVGSELYPVTTEGRVLAIFVMVYGVLFAGYLTAALATVLTGNQQSETQPAAPPAVLDDRADLTALRDEIRALRADLAAIPAASLSIARPPTVVQAPESRHDPAPTEARADVG